MVCWRPSREHDYEKDAAVSIGVRLVYKHFQQMLMRGIQDSIVDRY